MKIRAKARFVEPLLETFDVRMVQRFDSAINGNGGNLIAAKNSVMGNVDDTDPLISEKLRERSQPAWPVRNVSAEATQSPIDRQAALNDPSQHRRVDISSGQRYGSNTR